jgi:hypothetical protein
MQHAESDVAGFVALDVRQQIAEHGLDLRLGQEPEDHHGRAFGEDLHREQLDGEVARREQAPCGDREIAFELRRGHVERAAR